MVNAIIVYAYGWAINWHNLYHDKGMATYSDNSMP